MSAREAVQKLARLGVNARLTGDGFVISQEPASGAPLDTVNICHLTLARSPAGVLASASSP